MTTVLRPVTYDFVLQRGDTPRPLGVRMTGRSVRTGSLLHPPLLGTVIWTIAWPAGTQVRTSAPGGGLVTDARTLFTYWNLTQADVDAVAAGYAVPYQVRVQATDGSVRKYLAGTLTVEGSTL